MDNSPLVVREGKLSPPPELLALVLDAPHLSVVIQKSVVSFKLIPPQLERQTAPSELLSSAMPPLTTEGDLLAALTEMPMARLLTAT